MDSVAELLIAFGYWGLLAAAFVAGSIFPFPSEAVFVGLQALGLSPFKLVVFGTVGNVLGGLFSYGVGRMGKIEWIERYLRIKKKDLDRAQRFMKGRGAWMGFFAMVPLVGTPITVTQGLMRSNLFITTLSMTIGKCLRYVLLAYGTGLII